MLEYVGRIVELAKNAYENGDIPVGAIIVKNGKVIGEGLNTRNSTKSVIGHAEIAAIEMACQNIGDWRLDNCDLYITLKPCMMCTGAVVEARIRKVYYLCDRTNVRFNSSKYISSEKIDAGDINKEYMKLLQSFFEKRRNK